MEKKLLTKVIISFLITTIVSIILFSAILFSHEKKTIEKELDYLLNQMETVYTKTKQQVEGKMSGYISNYINQLNTLDFVLSHNKDMQTNENLDQLRAQMSVSDIYMIDSSGRIKSSSCEAMEGARLLNSETAQPAWELVKNPKPNKMFIAIDDERILPGVTDQDYFLTASDAPGSAVTMIGVDKSILARMEDELSLEHFIKNAPTKREDILLIINKTTGKILGMSESNKYFSDMDQALGKEELNTLTHAANKMQTLQLKHSNLFIKSKIVDDTLLASLTEAKYINSSIRFQLLYCGMLLSLIAVFMILLIRSHFRKYIFEEFNMIENAVVDLISGKDKTDFRSSNNEGTEIENVIKVLNDWKTNFKYKEEQLSSLSLELEQAMKISEHDYLTGLLNRYGFEKYLNQWIADPHAKGILLIADLDNFKTLNDTLGHPEGDDALKIVAEYLKSEFRESDITARLGGDEFAVFIKSTHKIAREVLEEKLDDMVERIPQSLPDSYRNCGVSVSIGAIFLSEHRGNYADLYKEADKALYQAKKSGKNQWAIL